MILEKSSRIEIKMHINWVGGGGGYKMGGGASQVVPLQKGGGGMFWGRCSNSEPLKL